MKYVGIIGTAFMAESVFAITSTPPRIIVCILLYIPGFVGWILHYFVYKKVLKKAGNSNKVDRDEI